MKQVGTKALLLFLCLTMLMSMMTVVTVGAADATYNFNDASSALTGWTQWTADGSTFTIGHDATAGVDGTGSMKVTGIQTGGRINSPSYTWKKGNDYKITVWLKANKAAKVQICANAWTWMNLTMNGGQPQYYRCPNTTVDITTEWKEYTFEWSLIDFVTSNSDPTSTGVAQYNASVFLSPTVEDATGFELYADNLTIQETARTVAEPTNEYFTSGKGDGTEDAPYELTTVEDLTKMNGLLAKDEAMRSAHYILMNDIDMSDVTDFKGLATINDARGEFSGTFDGNGHIISNITVDRMSENHQAAGLFIKLNKATIKNLGVENADIISGSHPVGIFACTDLGGSVIENCFVRNSKVTNGYAWGTNYTGGMIGTSGDANSDITTFNNCYVVGLTTVTRKGGADTELITTASNGAFKATILGQDVAKAKLTNCYTDYPNLISNGSQGNEDDNTECTVTNCYKNATTSTVTAAALGNAFIENTKEYNDGLPVLAWEADKLEESKENSYFTTGVGDGSETNPYQITTADDIAKMAELFATKKETRSAYYKLMNDLDLSTLPENFQGLGTYNSLTFTGTFDGNGHVIKNLSIDSRKNPDELNGNRPRGLFQGTQNATIKNLGIEDSAVYGFPAAAIIGQDNGGSTVEGCYVRNSTIACSNSSWVNYSGAIVGQNLGGGTVTTIKNCYSTALKDMAANEGGIMGAQTWSNSTAANMINCYTTHGRLESNGNDAAANVNWTTENCYVSATAETVTAAALGSAFIANTTSYNSGLPVLAWEESRLSEEEPDKEPEEKPDEPDEPVVPDKETNEYFTSGKGNGTKELPYELTTVEDLTKMSELFAKNEDMRSAHYKLMNDIDMSDATDFKGLAAIADARGTFSGTFDGNGHVISNITVDRTAEGAQVWGAALFMILDKATIKNLGVENASVTGFTPVGIFAARDKGGSTIENCYVKNSTLTNTYAWGTNYTGGMIGIPDSATSGITTFNNCYVLGLTTITRKGGADSELIKTNGNGAFKATILGQDVVKAELNNCYTDNGTLVSNGATGDASNNGEYTVNNSYASVVAGGKVNSMTLGTAYLSNDTDYNGGLPVLAWEESRMPARSGAKVVLAIGENGGIEKDGQKLSNGAVIDAKLGEDLTFTIVPDADYLVEEITVNGEKTVTEDNVITISKINTDTKISVTFVHSKFGGLTKPDKTIIQNVKDAYITKEGLENSVAVYTFDTEADVAKWMLTDEGRQIKEGTQSWDEAGANGTTGAYKHVATGADYRPRITGPNKINWNVGSKYEIKVWAKADSELGMGAWLNHGATIKTDFNPAGGAWLGLPNKTLTTEWKEYIWEFEITGIEQSGTAMDSVSVEYNTRINGNNPAGTMWLDEISITEILPGYTKLGLTAESTLLFPNETAPLTVVGNNGRNSYKVKPDGLTFTSFDEDVATVDQNGVVTAKANGVTRIIVSDGVIEGAIDITVSDVNNAKSELHVALNGSDATGDGSIDAPYATIDKAQTEIQGYRRLPEGGVTVYLHEGEYVLSDTLTFTEEDSGKKDAPITYKAYKDDQVDFVGSKKLDTSKIQKVTDEALLDRLIEDHAKDDLYMLDLGAQGVTMSAIASYGWGAIDTPTRIFMNGTGLINARWPNDDKTGEQYFTRGEPATAEDLSAEDAELLEIGSLNGMRQPAVMKFVDPENRSAKWTVKSGDVLFGGAIAYLWAKEMARVDYVDAENKVVKTLDSVVYGQNTHTPKDARYFYFANLFEEIDMPGESYVDRENGILYFYPVGNVEGAEMEVSVLDRNLVNVKGASNIVFDGINFRNSRKDGINIDENSDSITVKNAEISGLSGSGILTYGSNVKIDGCHIYDMGAMAVGLYGGDRATLTSSGTELTNCKIHNTNHYYATPLGAVQVEGVGHRIAHNEMFDIDHTGIMYSDTNNVITEYNKFYDNCRITADAGVLYWGRNISEFGNIVRYNYFYDIGGHIGNYGQQSVFTDDGNIGVAVYGNIMYKGGLPDYPLKTGNGQFHRVYNNIFIGSKSASLMSWWGEYHVGNDDEKRPVSWWTYLHDVIDLISDGRGNSNNFSRRKNIIYGDNYEYWKEYYSSEEMQAINSQWKLAFDSYLSEEKYNEAKALYDAKDADGLRKWLEENLPSGYTNIIEDNLLVDVSSISHSKTDVAEKRNNLQLSGAEGQAIFEDYGTDFNLTAEGLAKVRQTISNFPDLDFDAMGLEFAVGGVAPVASNASIAGTPIAGNELTASYTYEDADGDVEGISKIYWYVSDKENGEYERIIDGYGASFTVPEGYEGKYVRYEVVPYDVKSVYGEAVTSEAIYIDKQDNALLSDLKLDGIAIPGFNAAKTNYMITADEMPEITAIAAIEGATVTITKNSDTLPVKFTITVTAVDGKTTKTYVVAVSAAATTSPTPTATPTVPGTTGGSTASGTISGIGSSAGIAGGIGNGSNSATAKNQFVDIINHWAEDDINELAGKGIVNGVDETHFEPDREITRAEFATLVVKALNISAANSAGFEDVSPYEWYADYVNTAASAGLIQGYNGYFRPQDTITREEMAVILTKAYVFLGHTAATGGIVKFEDAGTISDWAYTYVDQMTTAGLISGVTETQFAPKSHTTRAQAAAVLKRLLDQ